MELGAESKVLVCEKLTILVETRRAKPVNRRITPMSAASNVSTTAWPEGCTEAVSDCPSCGCVDRATLYEGLTDALFGSPGSWRIVQCTECSSAYLDPRPTPDSLHLAYNSYHTHKASAEQPGDLDFKGWIRQGLVNDYLYRSLGHRLRPRIPGGRIFEKRFPAACAKSVRLYRHLSPPHSGQTLLDVGCGSGEFLTQARQLGWTTTGVEFDPQAAEVARRDGNEVFVGTLEQAEFRNEQFDVITLSHVIEHLPHPNVTLSECNRIMKPGGVLWVATPNASSSGSRKYGRYWRGLEPPRHLIVFDAAELQRAFQRAGFRDVRLFAGDITFFTYVQSYRIKEGLPPYGDSPVPDQVYQEAGEAWLASLSNPLICDEIVAIGRRREDKAT